MITIYIYHAKIQNIGEKDKYFNRNYYLCHKIKQNDKS